MDLQIFWFCLIAVFWSGYFLLEGFDFGVGMLLPFLPRNERERGAMFETIGPVWTATSGSSSRGDLCRVPRLVRGDVLGLLIRRCSSSSS
jgi:hypothetical protein